MNVSFAPAMSCPICHDTHWKSIVADGVDQVVRCDCWREALVGRILAQAGIPRTYNHCELSNFEDRGTNSLTEALRLTKAFADRFPVVERGIFFLGPPGVGKTHLAVAALKHAIRNGGARGFFYKSAELLQKIRNTYNKTVDETEMDVVGPVFDADLLVLDDVGVERPTEWVQETLGVLIDRRYSTGKSTILTGNLNDEVDGPAFADSVQFRLGRRTHSRLKEMCDWVFIEGYDTRVTGIHPSDREIAEWSDREKRLQRQVPDRAKGMARARLRPTKGDGELKWTGGKAGT